MGLRFTRPAIIIGAIVLGLFAVFWFFWPQPLSAPDEARRIRHPAGYSIVIPVHFECSINLTGDETYADALTAKDTRYGQFGPIFDVQRFRQKPDPDHLAGRGFKQPGTYLGHQALIFNGPSGRGKTAYWKYRAVVEISGQWFEIGVAEQQYFDMQKSAWKPYFESFKFEPPESATQPATRKS